VINLSLGLAGPSAAVEAALDDLDDDDVIVFASAGNSGLPEVGWPARYESAVAVAAVGPDRLKADFSAYGAEVRLLAPGVDVYSAMPGGQWATWSGTSMACALASGAASRMKSLYYADLPESDDTEEALAAAAVSVDALQPELLGLLGSGLVDVAATAVLLAADGG
jgi:subtilisin family serine protease